jgi:hypothetical protein
VCCGQRGWIAHYHPEAMSEARTCLEQAYVLFFTRDTAASPVMREALKSAPRNAFVDPARGQNELRLLACVLSIQTLSRR